MTRLLKTKQEIHVGISEYKIAQYPDKLMTVGLGSCVGTIIYDEKSKIGGLSHIMLPDSQPFSHKREIKPGKFADLALPNMVAELQRKVRAPRFKAKIVGGANMFQFQKSRIRAISDNAMLRQLNNLWPSWEFPL